jgi:TM2 domain-containing membrane protein YozV
MYPKIYRITILVVTLGLAVYIIPFLSNGILVDTQTNSGPPLIVINSNDQLNVKLSQKRIDKSGLYTLNPLDSNRGPMKSGHYIIHGFVSGIRKSDDDRYYFEYNVRGILPVIVFKGMIWFLIVLIFISVFLMKGYFSGKSVSLNENDNPIK